VTGSSLFESRQIWSRAEKKARISGWTRADGALRTSRFRIPGSLGGGTQADSGTDHHEIFGLRFDTQGIGGVKAVNVEWWTVDDGNVVNHDSGPVQLPTGNVAYDNFDITSATSFDQVYVRFTYETKADTSGVRLENFETQVPNPVPDQEFTFGINAVDQDHDPAQGRPSRSGSTATTMARFFLM
jgi:hypothetical protein